MVKKEAKNLKKSSEGLGTSGFTLGVLSIVLAGWLGIILAIIGFIFCKRQQKTNPINLGKTGMILNVVGFILSVVLLVFSQYILVPLIESGAVA